MNENKKNLPASIHARLLNLARNENRPLNELLQYYAIERFLYRLGKSVYRQNFVLKGAQMLRAWSAPLARPTMDIDLLGKVNNDIENLEKIVRQCCVIEFEDGVSFDAESVKGELIRKDAEYQGVRVLLKGSLGKIRLHLQIDFGFGDAVVPAPIEIDLPQLLDLGKPHLLGYTPESAIAEKFQAMVALDMTNTRMKDFYDIWLLSNNLKFDKKILAEAIKETFKRRNTPLPDAVPMALTSEFSQDETKQKQWKAFLRKNRLDTVIELFEVVREIEDFLMPIVSAIE
ncbi:nucleotidyl transferase AbiEii/AbiGii toxin family protein [soil metagenome]